MAETYYQILGVGVKASAEEIRAAYKKLALAHHPDRNQGSRQHEERFKQILEAYQTLSNPKSRGQYDVKLFYKVVTGNASASPDPLYRGVPKTRRDKEREEYMKRRPAREAYREYKGPPIRERVTAQSFALTLLVLGTLVMILLWLGDFMNHWTAKKRLAEGSYALALELDPEYGEAYFARFKHRKTLHANRKLLLQDINLAIRYTSVPYDRMYLERARLFFNMDSVHRSITDYLMAKTVNPGCDTAFFALGELNAYYLNNPKKALLYYDSTLALVPRSFEANYGKAYMLFRLKRFAQAIQQFNHSFTLNPNHPPLFFYRGSSRLAMGDTVGACTDLDQSLTMGVEDAKPLVDRYCLTRY